MVRAILGNLVMVTEVTAQVSSPEQPVDMIRQTVRNLQAVEE
jgi:hypothetical protein